MIIVLHAFVYLFISPGFMSVCTIDIKVPVILISVSSILNETYVDQILVLTTLTYICERDFEVCSFSHRYCTWSDCEKYNNILLLITKNIPSCHKKCVMSF